MLGSEGNLSYRRFYASSTFPSFLGFPSSSSPSLSTFLGAMQTDSKSCQVIYSGFSCAQYRLDIYGNSSHHKATDSPGKVQVSEGKRNTDISGDFLLSKQAMEPLWAEQSRRCRPVCGRCFLELVQRNPFLKEAVCLFQQKLPERVVFSVLTQLNKLKDSMGVFFFLKFMPGCPSCLTNSWCYLHTVSTEMSWLCVFLSVEAFGSHLFLHRTAANTPGNCPERWLLWVGLYCHVHILFKSNDQLFSPA